HAPFSTPVSETPRSMSVIPERGKFFDILKLGILTAEEQSKVPVVLNRKIVGIPEVPMLFIGKYPPLAVTSMICLPSSTYTLFIFSSVVFFNSPDDAEKYSALKISTAVMVIEIKIIRLFFIDKLYKN